jgi:hypothetical protein
MVSILARYALGILGTHARVRIRTKGFVVVPSVRLMARTDGAYSMSPALYWWLFLNVMARSWNPPKLKLPSKEDA